jgi:hypothetical protein
LAFVPSTPATIGETYVPADPGIPPRLSDVIAGLRQAAGRRLFILPLPTEYVEIPLRMTLPSRYFSIHIRYDRFQCSSRENRKHWNDPDA